MKKSLAYDLIPTNQLKYLFAQGITTAVLDYGPMIRAYTIDKPKLYYMKNANLPNFKLLPNGYEMMKLYEPTIDFSNFTTNQYWELLSPTEKYALQKTLKTFGSKVKLDFCPAQFLTDKQKIFCIDPVLDHLSYLKWCKLNP